MKKSTTKALALLLIIMSIVGSIVSCSDSKTKETTKETSQRKSVLEIPELLERSEILGSEKEEELYKKKYKEFTTALTKNPADHKASIHMAELFIAEARVTGEHPHYYPAALVMVNNVLDRNPAENDIKFQALSLKASVLLSLHEFQKGLDVASSAVKLNPYNANIYGALVDANVELGNYEEAVKMADKMMSIRPDLRSYSRVSYLREIHGDVKGSIEAMDMAVKAGYPGYEATAWARYTLGKIYENYGDLQNAEMQYQIVLRDRPNYAFALDGLANLEMKKGNYEKAEELLNKAVAIIPEVSFYESLANLYAATGREEKSKSTAQEIITMMKEDEASGHKMDLDKGKVHLDLLGNPDKALSSGMVEYKARPKNIDVNLFMAQVALHQKDWDNASKYLDAASSTGSTKPSLFLCQGVLAKNQGDNAKAKEYFDKALKGNPFLSGQFADLARVAHHKG